MHDATTIEREALVLLSGLGPSPLVAGHDPPTVVFASLPGDARERSRLVSVAERLAGEGFVRIDGRGFRLTAEGFAVAQAMRRVAA